MAYVMVYATDRSRWGIASRYWQNHLVFGDPPLVIDGLPPGDYLAVAIPIRHEILAARDLDVREVLRNLATRFTLHAAETKEVPLKVVDPRTETIGPVR